MRIKGLVLKHIHLELKWRWANINVAHKSGSSLEFRLEPHWYSSSQKFTRQTSRSSISAGQWHQRHGLRLTRHRSLSRASQKSQRTALISHGTAYFWPCQLGTSLRNCGWVSLKSPKPRNAISRPPYLVQPSLEAFLAAKHYWTTFPQWDE